MSDQNEKAFKELKKFVTGLAQDHFDKMDGELKTVHKLIKEFYDLDPRKRLDGYSDGQRFAISQVSIDAFKLQHALENAINEFKKCD